MKAHVSMFALLVACGGSGTNAGDDDSHIDAPMSFHDAPSNIPAMITVSGTAAKQGQSGDTPEPDVAIAMFKRGDDSTPLATATSDAQGKYTMSVATNMMPVDGYIKATKSGFVDTYSYPSDPLVKDFPMGDANMLDTSTFGLLVQFAGGHAGNGVIVMLVLDATGNPAEGVKVASDPASGAYKYSDSGGLPTSTTATAADGRSFMVDVPPGDVTVSATKSGSSFHSHQLTSRADVFTTTVITP
jgi:hypothetical protein